MEPQAAPSAGRLSFPPPIIVAPTSTHRITIIVLHGRGQTGEYFHSSFLSTPAAHSHTTNLRDALPHGRFVFPTAPLMRATKYRRSLIHQWYDGSGDWEPEARGNMRESVEHIQALIRDEVRLLGGDASRVVLMGFSQGCAMALTSLLLWEGDALGAVVGMSGFIPLNAHMTDLLEGQDQGDEGSDDGFVFGSDSSSEHGSVPDDSANGVKSPLQQAIRDLRDEAELSTTSTCMSPLSFLQTPVFIGHGTEDPKVKYVHGRLAARLLEKMGIRTEFHTYQGLGHCLSADMLGDVLLFLNSTMDLDNSNRET